jgi:Cdc6-like AAA superfamily ATPase
MTENTDLADAIKETTNQGPRKGLWKVPLNMTIYGSTGCGKTTYAKQILKDFLIPQLDYVVIMSPTMRYTDDWNEFKENTDTESKALKLFKIDTDFEPVMTEIIESQSDLILANGQKKTPQIMVILDDMLDHKIISNHGVLAGFSAKSRHLNISLMFLSQRISAVARTIRLNSSIVALFSNFNHSENCTFVEQYVNKKNKTKLLNKLDKIFDVKYNFILADNRNQKVSQRLLLNGFKIIDFDGVC